MTTHGLLCKIIKREGKRAKIEIEGQPVEVPADFLPAKIKEGQELKLYFLNSQQASAQEKNLAKYILEEILNGK